jgi:hypothetical protein
MTHRDQSRTLEDLSAEIVGLRASELALLQRLAEVRSMLTKLEVDRGHIVNANASIHSLPDDVFLYIVKIGQELDSDSNDPDSLLHEPFQLLVSRVSRRWQMMVLDAPLLWTRIRCRPRHYLAIERLEAFLMRSQRCLLDITFNMSDIVDHSPPKLSHRIRGAVNLLVSHADRWKSLVVLGGSPAYLSYTLKALRRIKVPQLTHFAVEKLFIDDFRPIPSDFGLFAGDAPSLSSVSFQDCNILSQYLPDLTRITSLQLLYQPRHAGFGDSGWEGLRQTLATLPSLTYLSIPGYVTRDIQSPIKLPYLLNLEINILQPSFVDKLCASLSTPSLDTLVLNSLCLSDILRFVKLSPETPITLRYPALRSLEIRWGGHIELDAGHSIIGEFMHAFSNITHLTMWSEDYDKHFDVVLKHVTEHASGPDGLLPQLQSITIQSPFASDLDVISAMISARIEAGRPISRLVLERVAWRWKRMTDRPAEACRAPSSRRLEQIKELRKIVNLEVQSGRTVFKTVDTYGRYCTCV